MKPRLRLHDTQARKRRDFEPIDPAHVRMYVCGPTVYDHAHIGNARPVVVFDLLYRVLKALYPKVTYVRNVTDVDDKINARARETGEDIAALTDRTYRAYRDDMASLNALRPDREPRATEHIPEMIAMVEALTARGFAYEAEGHVLFGVSTFDDYGSLSGRSRNEQIAGARVEVAPYKKDPADFVLWKPSDAETPGWDSPWGRGRPGWHLECSAMSSKYLGETFDIHGGGQDLVFPHHENEIAQSVCAHGGTPFVRYWMHNGHLMVEGEKMSKSLGNFYTVHGLLNEYPGEAIRLALMMAQYRQPLDFTKGGIATAKRKLDGWYRVADPAGVGDPAPDAVFAALVDDLNTPLAISEMDALAARARGGNAEAARALSAGGAILGLLARRADVWFQGAGNGDAPDAGVIEAMISERLAARNSKDFARADQIRDELKTQGVRLEDGPGGATTWTRT